jgi:hypothetical protein
MKACFIIRPGKGNPLYLTPFVDPKTAVAWDEDEEIKWHASTGLTAHEKDDALFTLYSQIDRGVDRWIQDARYLPRLLLSAAMFLLIYFFFSLAIRDPIPMVDELVLASGAAIGTAIFLSKRDKKGEMAMKRRLELKQNASRCDFAIEESIAYYEEYIDTCAHFDTLELADRLANVDDRQLPQFSPQEELPVELERMLTELLMQHMRLQSKKLYTMHLRVLEENQVGKEADVLGARLVKLAMRQELDLPLLAFMVMMSKRNR